MPFKLPTTENIVAIMPFYSTEGDMTAIYLATGEILKTKRRIKTLLQQLATRHKTTLPILRNISAQITNLRIMMPLAFSWEFILLPLQVRHPLIAGDNTLGYINLKYLHHLEDNEETTCLHLTTGQKFQTLWKKETTEKHISQAKHLALETGSSFDSSMLRRISEKYLDTLFAKLLN